MSSHQKKVSHTKHAANIRKVSQSPSVSTKKLGKNLQIWIKVLIFVACKATGLLKGLKGIAPMHLQVYSNASTGFLKYINRVPYM